VDRLERLVNLVAALIEAPRPLRREEIRERVPGYAEEPAAFRRMFERDKETIRQMGIPLSVLTIDADSTESTEGYRILREQYELPDPGLHPDELAALHLAASAVEVGGAAPGTEALWKLGGGASQRSAPPSVAIPGSDHLSVLFGAMAESRTVVFRYRGADRTVDPWRLSFHNGHWYLAGYDHSRSEERSFRLDRFETAPLATGPVGAFERPADSGRALPHPWELGDADDAVVEAHLLVDAGHAGWAIGEIGEAAVRERRPDGSIVFSLSVRNQDAFRSFVVGFLDHAEVLGPPELRAGIVQFLTTLVA
jgi:predicted DNA-binding transcriptional regulator YafY